MYISISFTIVSEKSHHRNQGRDLGDVGVREDNGRVVAAQFQSHSLYRLRRRSHNPLARRNRPCEANLVDIWVVDQSRTERVVAAEGLYKSRREDLVGNLDDLECGVSAIQTSVFELLRWRGIDSEWFHGAYGVNGLGLTMMALPIWTAGSTLARLNMKGKFQGQMATATPNGTNLCRTCLVSKSSSSPLGSLRLMCQSKVADIRRTSMAPKTRGLPVSLSKRLIKSSSVGIWSGLVKVTLEACVSPHSR